MCIRLNNLVQVKELHMYLCSNFKIQMQDMYHSFMSVKTTRSMSNAGGTMSSTNFKKHLTKILYEQEIFNREVKAKTNKIINGLTHLLVYRVIKMIYG